MYIRSNVISEETVAKCGETLYRVGTPCYVPGMASEKRIPLPVRFPPSWIARVQAQADRETRDRTNLIERVMAAYCGDSRIQELVRMYEDKREPDSSD
jgi:hypothetical protein